MIFFHLSDKDVGAKCLFEPKTIPYEPRVINLKRTCVAPSVRQCLLAIGGVRGNQKITEFHIYSIDIDKTDEALDMEWPKTEVDDQHLTEEAWILFPREFKKTGILHRETWGSYDNHNELFIKEPTFSIEWL
jgi:hypothetical protein